MRLPVPYYRDDWATIYHADCRNVLPLLEPVDCVITDPPYGVSLTGKAAKQRGGGIVKSNLCYLSHDDSQTNFETIVLPAVHTALAMCRRAVITPGIRQCFHYPPPDDIGCFYSAAGTGVGRWGFTCSQPILYYGKDPFLEHGQGSRPNSLGQRWPNDANEYAHPCAKPIALVKWLVWRASWVDETILDPFMGSGTTLRAAKDLNRRAIGIEISEEYCAIAAKRLRQETMNFNAAPAAPLLIQTAMLEK